MANTESTVPELTMAPDTTSDSPRDSSMADAAPTPADGQGPEQGQKRRGDFGKKQANRKQFKRGGHGRGRGDANRSGGNSNGGDGNDGGPPAKKPRLDWHRDSNDRRRKRENPFTADEIAAEERRPKRKVAVLIGYSGTGYRGLQINNDEKTIESDIMKAFIAAGAIAKANADDPKKVSLVRCARTDKGVHAAGNVLSLKLIIEEEGLVEKINEHLPEQIRVWGVHKTNRNFSCYVSCDSRWYEYLLPSYSLLPPHPDSFIGQKMVEFAKEKGMLEAIAEMNKDVEGFWEKVDEEKIKPILEKLDPETRAAVLERTRSTIEVVVDAEGRERSQTPELQPLRDPTGDNVSPAPLDAEVQTSAPEETTKPDAEGGEKKETGDDTQNPDKPQNAPRELTAVDFALRDVKEAYIAAKRSYRISTERLNRLQEVLSQYAGTNNFHNYTIQKSFKDPSAKRHIKSFEVNPNPVIIGDTEWLSLKVHGQSFMMHQIRKMVGLASLIVRCGSDPALVRETYGPDRIAIPKAPALGLLLECPVFDSYNQRMADAMGGKEPLDFGRYKEQIELFKREYIYKRIFEDEEREHTFHSFYQQIDNFKTDYFLWITPGGIQAAKLRDGSLEDRKAEAALDKRLGEEEEERQQENEEG